MGKRTAQKDTFIDTSSDSQVNSNFPYRRSPASITFYNYFYLFLYLYITGLSINNNTPHPKPPKNQTRKAAPGRPAMKSPGAPTSPRPTNPRTQIRIGPSDTQPFGLRGRFPAHKCTILETQKSKLI